MRLVGYLSFHIQRALVESLLNRRRGKQILYKKWYVLLNLVGKGGKV